MPPVVFCRAQHLFFSNNVYKQVWIGDREILTLDPLFGSYNGGVVPVTSVQDWPNGTLQVTNATQGTVLLFATDGIVSNNSHMHIDAVRADAENTSHSQRSAALNCPTLRLSFPCVQRSDAENAER